MHRVICVSLILLAGGCAKATDPVAGKPGGGKPAEAWLVYEDDLFRVEYPPGSDVVGAQSSKQDRANPSLAIVPPPAANSAVFGGLYLQLDHATKSMLLRDAIQNEIQRDSKDNGIVLSPPRLFNVKNGRCLGAIVISPSENCPKNSGGCFAPLYQMQCDAPEGVRYSAGTILSPSQSRNSLSPRAQQEAAVYERILRSLEFKKS